MLRSLVGSEMCIRDRDKPHNMYLQIAVNTGVISLIAFLLLIGYYAFESIRLYIKSDFSTYKSIAGIGIFLAVTAVSYTHLTLPTIYSV